MSTATSPKRNWSDLRARVISAIVMAVVGFSLVYSGFFGTALLVFVGAIAMVWEWSRMTTSASTGEKISGYAVIILASLGFLWLRSDPEFGFLTAIWLVLVVVAADVGAYFAGRFLGGPKLAPSISPNKTISGALGGLSLSLIVGCAVAVISGAGTLWIIAVVSLFTAIASQIGDLAESSAKRRHGIKDSSNILPGHGGALDRFDGLLAAILFVAVLTLLARSSVFAW